MVALVALVLSSEVNVQAVNLQLALRATYVFSSVLLFFIGRCRRWGLQRAFQHNTSIVKVNGLTFGVLFTVAHDALSLFYIVFFFIGNSLALKSVYYIALMDTQAFLSSCD